MADSGSLSAIDGGVSWRDGAFARGRFGKLSAVAREAVAVGTVICYCAAVGSVSWSRSGRGRPPRSGSTKL
jgi:hypothetical protein